MSTHSHTTRRDRIADRLTHVLFPLALLFVLADLTLTVIMYGIVPERNPVVYWLYGQLGWEGVGLLGVLVVWLAFEVLRAVPKRFDTGWRTCRLGMLALMGVLAVPVVWNASVFVAHGQPAFTTGHVIGPLTPVVGVAVLALVGFNRDVLSDLSLPGERVHYRAVCLAAIMFLSMPAMSFSFGGVGNHDGVAVAEEDEWVLLETLDSGDDEFVGDAAYSPDGNYFAHTTSDSTVYVYDTSDWSVVETLTEHGSGTTKTVEFSPDGNYVVYGGQDDTTYVHETSDWTLEETLTEVDSDVNTIAFSPDGSEMVTAGFDDSAYVYDTSDWSVKETLTEQSSYLESLSYSPTGDYLAYASRDANVYVHDTSDWTLEETLTEVENSAHAVDFSSDGSQIAYGGAQNYNVFVHDTSGWTLEETLSDPGDRIEVVTYSPSGLHLAFGARDERAHIYDTSDWSVRETSIEMDSDVSSIAFSPDGSEMAIGTGTEDGVYIYGVPGPTISGTIVDVNGEPVEDATVQTAESSTTTGADGTYDLSIFDAGTYTVTANTSIDEDHQTVTVGEDGTDGVDFTLLDGDVGGQVLSCGPTDIRCADGTPVAEATVVIKGLNHTAIEDLDPDIDSAEEAREEADRIREELNEFDLEDSIEEAFDVDFGWTASNLRERFDDQGGEYVVVHPEGAWAEIEGAHLTHPLRPGFGELRTPIMYADPSDPLVLSIWDAAQSPRRLGAFRSEVDKSLPGRTVSGTIEIERIGPGGEVMATSETSTVPFLEEQSFDIPGTDFGQTTHEAVPRAPNTFDEGIYRFTPAQSEFATWLVVGDPDVSDIAPGWTEELEDAEGELLSLAERFKELRQDGILELTTADANEDGYWQADLPELVETVSVTAAKAGNFLDAEELTDPDTPELIADALADTSQFEIIGAANDWEDIDGITAEDGVTSLDEALATLDDVDTATQLINTRDNVDELGLRFGDEYRGSIYIPADAEQADVPARIDPRVREVSAARFLEDFGDLDDLRDEELEDWLDDEFLDLLEEWLDGDIDEILERLENLEGLLGEFDEDDLEADLEDLLDELDLDIEDLIDIDPDEFDNEELIERIQELEAVIGELAEEIDAGEVEVEDNLISGVFPFPGEIQEATVKVQYADGTQEVIPDDHWHIESAASAWNPFDDAEQVVVDGFEIDADRPNPRLTVDAVVDELDLMRQGDGAVNPAYQHDIPRLSSVDVSKLYPNTGDRVEVTPRAVSGTGFAGITDARVVDQHGDVNATIENNETVVFRPQNETEHAVHYTFENAAGHEFVETVSLRVTNDRSISFPTVRLADVPVAADDIREVTVDRDGDGEGTLTINIGGSDSVPEIHIRDADHGGLTAWDIEVVRGNTEEQVREHVSLSLHADLEAGEDLIWSQAGPITAAGDTQYGDYHEGIIRTYTDERGQADIKVDRDPSIFARLNHWRQVRFGGIPLLGTLSGLDLAGLVGGGTGLVLALFAARRRWFA